MRKFAILLLPMAAFLVLRWSLPAAAAALPHETVVIDSAGGAHAFRLGLAVTKAQQAAGLMHRKSLPPDAGMLFDFGQPVMCSFWMKDTPLPLDMLFVRADGRISTIAANAVPESTTQITSAEPVRAVIEIGGGRAHALGIRPGDVVHARAFGNAIGKAARARK